MKQNINIQQVVDEMKVLGDTLVPYNWPRNKPELENDLNLLKTRQVQVDGYNIILHFSRADYDTHYLETLQVIGTKAPFLPFCLVSRLAKLFLGDSYLYLVELLRDNRKIYCWSVTLDKEGRPISTNRKQKTETCTYDGWDYEYMYPSQINFY